MPQSLSFSWGSKYIKIDLKLPCPFLSWTVLLVFIQNGVRSKKIWYMLTLWKHLSYYKRERTSLVVQWLRIDIAMQGTWVGSLVQEDSTCCGMTKPLHHNYWSPMLRACAPQERPLQWEAHTLQLESGPTPAPHHPLQLEKVHAKQQRSSAAKSK